MIQNEKFKNEKSVTQTIMVDLIFDFLPLIIFIMIKIITYSFDNIFIRSDWSYISMILYSQSLIKLLSGIIQNSNKKNNSFIILIVSCILAFGLIPSILFLVLIEIGKINICIIICQITWLIISVVVYYFCGCTGLVLSENKTIKESDFEKTGE